MSEEWLYEPTFKNIKQLHSLNNLNSLFKNIRIYLSSGDFGTKWIQIDIIKADQTRKIIAMAEAKEFLSFQAVSECAEQLYLKKYLLKNFLNNKLWEEKSLIEKDSIREYQLLFYIALGSYSGKGYNHAKSSEQNDLKKRLDEYSKYLSHINRGHIGIFAFFK